MKILIMEDLPNGKKKRLWGVDSELYQKGQEAGLFESRIVPMLRQVGRFSLISLALAYPLALVVIGIVYGGLVFWSFFAGSVVAIYFIISKLGFAPRFRSQGQGFRAILGIIGGSILAAGFYEGLFVLKTWLIPAVIGLSAVGIFFVLRRLRIRR